MNVGLSVDLANSLFNLESHKIGQIISHENQKNKPEVQNLLNLADWQNKINKM